MKLTRSQKGVALIAVLWVIAFLATIAATVAHQSRSSLQMTKNRIDTLKLEQAAESALLISVANKINTAARRNRDFSLGSLDSLFEDIDIQLSVSDEAGKIDLNTAPFAILKSLMIELGINEDQADSLASAILDWRDEDSLLRPNGAEDKEYLAAGYGYSSKDASFESVQELQLVYGMNRPLFVTMQPYVTVYTHDFGVNTTVAPPLVQTAVKNAIALLQTEVSSEEENDPDSLDEGDFQGLDEFTSLTSGYIYTFSVLATNRSGVKKKLSAIVRIDRGNTYEPFTILSWN